MKPCSKQLGTHSGPAFLRTGAFLLALFCMPLSSAFTQNQNQTQPTGVLRIRVRVKSGEATRGLSRKRFFLIRGTLDQNATVIKEADSQPVVSRDCYYTQLGASQALINWLRESDCESVYCREVDDADVDGPGAVPEFVKAFSAGEKEFGSKELARKWLTTNVPEKLRDGFYKERQKDLQTLIKKAEASSAGSVLSVMTDRNGTAYFTDLTPGSYVLSSFLPVELAGATVTWNCAVEIKPGDLATEKPYQVSNRKDKNVKCVGVEKPLPVCEPVRTGDR